MSSGPRDRRRGDGPDARGRALHDRHDAARHHPDSRPDRPARQPESDLDRRRLERYNRGFSRLRTRQHADACLRSNPQPFEATLPGPHSFHAAALDTAPNVDPTPATAADRRHHRTRLRRPDRRRRSSRGPDGDRRDCCSSPSTTRAPAGACTSNTARRPPTGWRSRTRASEPGPADGNETADPVHDPGHALPLPGDDHDPLRERQHRRPDPDHETPRRRAAERSRTGTPRVTGQHAASLPVTIDPGGVATNYRLLIAAGEPVTAAATGDRQRREAVSGLSGPSAGPCQRRRPRARRPPTTTGSPPNSSAASANEALGPEGTFTTPPLPGAGGACRPKIPLQAAQGVRSRSAS